MPRMENSRAAHSLSRAVARSGRRRVPAGVQRATALCRSARCPRFILPSRRRRTLLAHDSGKAKGQEHGAIQPGDHEGRPAGGWESPLNRIRQQSPQAAKHGVCNSPDSLSGNAIGITGIHSHGYILPEREKKTREPRAEQRKKKRKESCSEDTRDKKQRN